MKPVLSFIGLPTLGTILGFLVAEPLFIMAPKGGLVGLILGFLIGAALVDSPANYSGVSSS